MLPGYALAAPTYGRTCRQVRPGRDLCGTPPLADTAVAASIAVVAGVRAHRRAAMSSRSAAGACCAPPERYRELSTVEYPGDSYIIDPRGEVGGESREAQFLIAEGSRDPCSNASPIVGGHVHGPIVPPAGHRPQPQAGGTLGGPGGIAGHATPASWR